LEYERVTSGSVMKLASAPRSFANSSIWFTLHTVTG
jgi:hypothetical protein